MEKCQYPKAFRHEKCTVTLYQNYGADLANPVDYDTVDDALMRILFRVHCIFYSPLLSGEISRPPQSDLIDGIRERP